MEQPTRGLTAKELESFKRSFYSLCKSFGVFIRDEHNRRERPGQRIYYYEVELSAKVVPDDVDLVD